MKVFFTISLCMLCTINLISQNGEPCGFVDGTDPDPIGVFTYSIDPEIIENSTPKVYNVFFWGIRRDDGTGNTLFTETAVLNAVANFNIAFNQFNIFFKYRGFDYINSTEYYVMENPGEFSDLLDDAELNGWVHENSFNIYVSNEYQTFGGIAEWYHKTNVGLPVANLTADTAVHEIGHCFNLRHLDSSGSFCERVTRDPNNPNFNATTAGDRVVDTNACYLFNSGDIENCIYVGNETDCSLPTPDFYDIEEEDIRNFLMRRTYPCDKLYFTVGQGIRMREAIIDDPYDEFADAETSVLSLYEPYAGEYYIAGPYNPLQYRPLFQPGFEYRFVECHCTCPAPSGPQQVFTYNSANVLLNIGKNETVYNNITHPNHSAILIKQETVDGTVYLADPQKCYDNFNKAASGGLITQFNDNIFNANVTLTPKDSTSINNPLLIDELPTGLYEIEKYYDDGAIQQTVIYKEDN